MFKVMFQIAAVTVYVVFLGAICTLLATATFNFCVSIGLPMLVSYAATFVSSYATAFAVNETFKVLPKCFVYLKGKVADMKEDYASYRFNKQHGIIKCN
jgi:hypothetical protein